MPALQHLEALAQNVAENLEYQHDWTQISRFNHPHLPRPVLFGLPPKRLYIHPDEQTAAIKAEKERKESIVHNPVFEWVLPTHINEKLSPSDFAAIFDAVDAVPPGELPEDDDDNEGDEGTSDGDAYAKWKFWKGPLRKKRLLLATFQDDSTVTYYFLHDGLVKPRQN